MNALSMKAAIGGQRLAPSVREAASRLSCPRFSAVSPVLTLPELYMSTMRLNSGVRRGLQSRRLRPLPCVGPDRILACASRTAPSVVPAAYVPYSSRYMRRLCRSRRNRSERDARRARLLESELSALTRILPRALCSPTPPSCRRGHPSS